MPVLKISLATRKKTTAEWSALHFFLYQQPFSREEVAAFARGPVFSLTFRMGPLPYTKGLLAAAAEGISWAALLALSIEHFLPFKG